MQRVQPAPQRGARGAAPRHSRLQRARLVRRACRTPQLCALTRSNDDDARTTPRHTLAGAARPPRDAARAQHRRAPPARRLRRARLARRSRVAENRISSLDSDSTSTRLGSLAPIRAAARRIVFVVRARLAAREAPRRDWEAAYLAPRTRGRPRPGYPASAGASGFPSPCCHGASRRPQSPGPMP